MSRKKRVGIIDCELVAYGPKFPNLASMKLSAYHKNNYWYPTDVTLILSPIETFQAFDEIYTSKVFTWTPTFYISPSVKVFRGGTGFDEPGKLAVSVYNMLPDYSLYNDVPNKPDVFTDYSIGRLTRGCFRHCSFCVNKNSDKVVLDHDEPFRFIREDRKKILLIDDNFFGYHNADSLLEQLNEIGKPYTFKQGLDLRLMTTWKAKLLDAARYDGDVYFAFDNIKDAETIQAKLKKFRDNCNKSTSVYILCGYYDSGASDIESIFKRMEILAKFGCRAYLMRYETCKKNFWKEMYVSLARYINQRQFCTKVSFEEFIQMTQEQKKKPGDCLAKYTYDRFIECYPDLRPLFIKCYYKEKTNEPA